MFLSYSPYALKFTKIETVKEPYQQLQLEMSDFSGVKLDELVADEYCQSKVELCASVGFWSDPDVNYIADDGVVR